MGSGSMEHQEAAAEVLPRGRTSSRTPVTFLVYDATGTNCGSYEVYASN